jgi:hypothetical protein
VTGSACPNLLEVWGVGKCAVCVDVKNFELACCHVDLLVGEGLRN